MKSALSRAMRALMLALVLTLSFSQTAVAASDDSGPAILRDTETELMFRDMSLPLIKAAGLDPEAVHVVLLNDPEINAFVATGQTVYVQSGLLLACDNVNQLQGVVAHELGHVTAGDAIRSGEGEHQALGVYLATMVLGAIAAAAGSPDAAIGLAQMGQRAAIGKLMAFTRGQEATADASAAKFLHIAGISGKGMLDFFGKLQNEEYRLADYSTDSFDQDHPLTSERIQALQQKFQADPAWNKALLRYPLGDDSIPGHYARAYAYHMGGYPTQALAEANALLADQPHDPFFLELKGQILLEDGKPADAVPPLREATQLSGDKPLIAALLGHALVATENPKNYAEAEQVLKTAVTRDDDDPDAWFQLGIIYDRQGDQARAALATAERSYLQADHKMALASAEMAMKGIPPGTPDYLRAQDIAMVAKAQLKDKKDKGHQ
jgi:predicted Zn-dependent protease